MNETNSRLKAKVVSSGGFLACCCPFCEQSGKTKDTKYHLRVAPGKWIYCYRCRVKKPYSWFINNFSLNIERSAAASSDGAVADVEFDVFLAHDTHKPGQQSFYDDCAMAYINNRKVTPDVVKALDVRIGQNSMHGRIVFVDPINRYYVGRSFLKNTHPKTINPPSKSFPKPLMYLRPKGKYETIFMVEGTFDAAPFVKLGRSVCCLLGKDISAYQLQMLKNVSVDNVVVALDSDAMLDAGAVADRVSSVMPMINVGVLIFNDRDGSDPADHDVNLFSASSIMWRRVTNNKTELVAVG